MADVIALAPTTSIEYILFKGLSGAVATADIEKRIEALASDRKAYRAVYKRIAIGYLQAELTLRSVEKA